MCRCGLPRTWPAEQQWSVCGQCITRPPPFYASHAPFRYHWPLDRLINHYKHHGQLRMERVFEQLLSYYPCPWPEADVLCPLPSHWQRFWQRGFDQSQRLAQIVGRQWHKPVEQFLARQQHTPPQQGLDHRQRQRNVRDAFTCVRPVADARVLLIDDVMTTGSSARAASRVLRLNGAREVQVWTLARA